LSEYYLLSLLFYQVGTIIKPKKYVFVVVVVLFVCIVAFWFFTYGRKPKKYKK